MTQSKHRTTRSNSATRSATAKTAATSKSTKTSTPPKATKTTKAKPKRVDFEIDPEVLDPGLNQVRRPRLPHGIIVNDDPCGIFIPEDQFPEIDFYEPPSEDELTTVKLSGKVRGLLLERARMLVLGYTPNYVRYKRGDDLNELSGTFVGLYDDCRSLYDQNRQIMEACSDHAIVLLDDDNQPLHSMPIGIRFKNVALWSFASARDKVYPLFERAFAKYTGQPFSGKTDRWRSLCVLDVQFVPEEEGKGRNKSTCCKTRSIAKPTAATLPDLFLGTPSGKETAWSLFDSAVGYAVLPQLTAASTDNGTALTAAPTKPKSGKSSARTAVRADEFGFDDEDDAIDVEAEALLDDDEEEGFEDPDDGDIEDEGDEFGDEDEEDDETFDDEDEDD